MGRVLGREKRGRSMLRPYKTKALDGASREAKTDLYLLLNFRKSFGREHAYGRVFEQGFFQSGDLIALRPTVKIQMGIALLDGNTHAEGPALNGGDSNHTNVQCKLIYRINGKHNGRTRFVQLNDIHLTALGIPARRSIRHQSLPKARSEAF